MQKKSTLKEIAKFTGKHCARVSSSIKSIAAFVKTYIGLLRKARFLGNYEACS